MTRSINRKKIAENLHWAIVRNEDVILRHLWVSYDVNLGGYRLSALIDSFDEVTITAIISECSKKSDNLNVKTIRDYDAYLTRLIVEILPPKPEPVPEPENPGFWAKVKGWLK